MSTHEVNVSLPSLQRHTFGPDRTGIIQLLSQHAIPKDSARVLGCSWTFTSQTGQHTFAQQTAFQAQAKKGVRQKLYSPFSLWCRHFPGDTTKAPHPQFDDPSTARNQGDYHARRNWTLISLLWPENRKAMFGFIRAWPTTQMPFP